MGAFYGADAVHGEIDLANGYLISVIRHRHSYGGPKGLYEIGVAHEDAKYGAIPEGWSDSVMGWLNGQDVEREINKLATEAVKYEKVRT